MRITSIGKHEQERDATVGKRGCPLQLGSWPLLIAALRGGACRAARRRSQRAAAWTAACRARRAPSRWQAQLPVYRPRPSSTPTHDFKLTVITRPRCGPHLSTARPRLGPPSHTMVMRARRVSRLSTADGTSELGERCACAGRSCGHHSAPPSVGALPLPRRHRAVQWRRCPPPTLSA